MAGLGTLVMVWGLSPYFGTSSPGQLLSIWVSTCALALHMHACACCLPRPACLHFFAAGA